MTTRIASASESVLDVVEDPLVQVLQFGAHISGEMSVVLSLSHV